MNFLLLRKKEVAKLSINNNVMVRTKTLFMPSSFFFCKILTFKKAALLLFHTLSF